MTKQKYAAQDKYKQKMERKEAVRVTVWCHKSKATDIKKAAADSLKS